MFKKLLFIFFLISSFEIITVNSFGVNPEEFLEDPKQELRARNFSKKVRCLVCQNQSIDESNAQLAKDLRSIIRKKINSGNSDKEIYDFLEERYGEFILLKPPLNFGTIALWFFPFVFVCIGIFIIVSRNKKFKKT